MKKIKSLTFLILLVLISCKKKIEVEYDEETNSIIYNNSIYNYSRPVNSTEKKEEKKEEPQEEKNAFQEFLDGFWFNFIGFIILAVFAGAMSGLTVGYLSVDLLTLEIKIDNGEQRQVRYAKKIMKVISDHHWILVTLLLCNAFACEAMPILLDKLVSEMMAIIISVTVLLFVGEIVPQALCTGPNQLRIASFLAPFTYCLMVITYPLSFPIAKFMDCVVGKHEKTRYNDRDLKSLLDIHMKERKSKVNLQKYGYFTGFLDALDLTVKEVLKPLDKVFKLENSYNINNNTIKNIAKKESIIPVYNGQENNIIGSFHIKQLVGKNVLSSVPLNQIGIKLNEPIHASENMKIIELYDKLKDDKEKIALIHQSPIKDSELPDEKEEKKIKNDNDEPLLKNDKDNKPAVVVFGKGPEATRISNMKEEEENEEDIGGQPIIGIVTFDDINEYFFKERVEDMTM